MHSSNLLAMEATTMMRWPRRPAHQPPARVILLLITLAFVTGPPLLTHADEDVAEPQELVEKARLTLKSFLADKNMSWLRDNLKDARGVLVVPQMIKGAFFIGGSGGSGVLLVRDEKTNRWSYPAFYTLGGLSFGFQFGGEASEVVLLLMSQKGVDSMLTSTMKLGADASVAVGPMGGRVEGATAPNLSADLVSFARSTGVFGGVSLEGAVIAARESWNSAYYGKPTRPVDIIAKRSVKNPHAEPLLSVLETAPQ